VNETVLTWNVTNWITVILMSAVGFLLVAVVTKGFHGATGNKYTTVGAVGGTPPATPT
jgi:hypothetical protein